MKPFLKWAGNKYKIIKYLKNVLPDGGRLVDPFVGSASVFLNTKYKSYLLADINADLINLYKVLQEEKESFITFAKEFFIPENNNEDKYYQFRELFNETKDVLLKSALFLYLNRHGYNGLCRYNKKNEFNTPFGRYKKPYFPEKELKFFIEKCKKTDVKFICQTFEKTLDMAKPYDVVYCDPPYIPLSKTSNFTEYFGINFGLEEHKKLAEKAKELAKKGIPVVISNHKSDLLIESYEGSKVYELNVRRFISCKSRDEVKEIMAVFK